MSGGGTPTETVVITRGVRSDAQCGPGFPLEDGSPARCDPDSPDFCCSAGGWCGHTEDHCNCETCKNYNPSGGEQNIFSSQQYTYDIDIK